MQEHTHNNQQLPSFDASNPTEARYFENEDVQNNQSPQPARDMNIEGQSQDQYMDHQPQYETPPIDFTGYQINRERHASTQPQQRPSSPNAHEQSFNIPQPESQNRLSPFQSSHNRKRSYSNTERDEANSPSLEHARANRLSSISSILNPTQQRREDMPIDPSLSLLGQQALRQSQTPQQPHPQLPPSSSDQKAHRPSNVDAGEWIAQRKAKLRQEMEQMRELLRAKERELEELDGEG